MNCLLIINLSPTLSDIITLFAILIIIAVAIWSIYHLYQAYHRFKLFMSKEVDEILESEELRTLTLAYKASLIDFKGEKKSLKMFEDKVSRSTLLNLFFNDKMYSSISNILVGLGILFTFIGLSIGVYGIKMESSDTIKESISSLLGGMGTAFLSSIFGMLFSLIFIGLYQHYKHLIAKSIESFYRSVDNLYLLTELQKSDFQSYQLQDSIKEVIKEYFVQEEDGMSRTPKFYYRELLANSRNQASSLSTFADDLASTLEDIIDKLLEVNSQKFQEIIEEKLVPILEQLREEKKKGADVALTKIVDALQNAMKEMMEEFKETISGETKGEMENLASSLSTITMALDKMPTDIQSLSGELTTNMSKLSDSIGDVVKGIYSEQEKSDTIRKAHQLEANNQLKSILDGVGNNIESLIGQQSVNSDSLSNILEQLNDVVSQNDQSINAFKDLLKNSRDTFENIRLSSNELKEATLGLNEGAKAVEYNNKKIKEAVQLFISSNNSSIDKIVELQSSIVKRNEEFINRYQEIDDSMENIFKQLNNGIDEAFTEFNQGLEGYTENLNSALSESIGKYADKSTETIDAINGITRELSEAIEAYSELKSRQ